MTGHSLRTRLVATTLLLLAVASAVVAVVTTIALRQFLITRLDADLRVSARVLIRAEPGSAPTVLFADRGPRPPDSLTAVVRDGSVLAAGVS
ncbi:MAG: two-component sensor histidine kinase, partial [Actinomycetes bacterium]